MGQDSTGDKEVFAREMLALVNPIESIAPDRTVAEVAELFLNPDYAKVLSLPVVENGLPLGVISRYRFMDMYLKQFARELHGKRAIRHYINEKPLLVELDQPLAEAALHVAEHMQFPLTEDFVITRHGKYLGVGFVMDLLKAMEVRMRANTEELNGAYSRLKSSQLALVQSEKMASLGQMVAGVAHEINTPLGYVQNNVAIGQELFVQVREMIAGYEALVDNLLNEQATDEQISGQMAQIARMRGELNAHEMLGEMQGLMADSLYGIGQISELVLNLKNFSRMDAAATEAVNLNSCIESALNIGRNVLKNKVEVIKELGDLPRMTCSPSHLNQVFLNLFTNAAQAMGENGQLRIRTWQDKDSIHVSVTDNGKGILPEHLTHIFDPFFTTKPVGEGTGLGLAISHQIILQHGGEIRVESSVGAGTTFYIRLPLAVGESSHTDSTVLTEQF
ncbi:MAG: ATP-binding protein [Gallionella sp.]|nr:ATP-binding protein [Gallionella sp.]